MKQQLKIRVVYDRTHVATLSDAAAPRPGLIQLEARYNGRKIYRAVASVYLDQFGRYNRRTHTTIGETVHNRADAEAINKQIQTTRAEMLTEFERCQSLGLTFSLDRFTANTPNGPGFIAWAMAYAAALPVASSTHQTKNTYIKTLDASALFRTFSDLTPGNVLALDAWLRSHARRHTSRPLSPGYIHNVHTFLHTLSVEAIRQGHISADPYRDFHNPKAKPAPRPFLTPEQIKLITEAPCIDSPGTHVHLRDARDLFLLQIYTGLAYIDVQNAPWLTARTSGVLQAQRQKTHTQYMVRISPAARAILDRWQWQPPRISSISLNEALQLVVCQAITGQPSVGLRNLSALPGSVVEALRSLKVTQNNAAQNDLPQVRALILLLLDTGVPFDVLSRCNLSTVKRSHTITYNRRTVSHSVALSPEALRLFDFLQWNIPNVTRATITNTLRRLIVHTVIPSLSTHIGRHTFGTVAINAGVPVAVLQRIMGHTNPNTTLIYAKLQPSAILDAFSLIDPETSPDNSK